MSPVRRPTRPLKVGQNQVRNIRTRPCDEGSGPIAARAELAKLELNERDVADAVA